MMKIVLIVLILLGVLGCASMQRGPDEFVEDLKSADIHGFGLLRPPSCACSLTVDEYLRDLTREANAVLEPDKQVHFVFVPSPVQTNAPVTDYDPFADGGTCPVHSSSPDRIIYTGQIFMSAWMRVQMFAELGGFEIEVAPESRTVILYNEGQQSPRCDVLKASPQE